MSRYIDADALVADTSFFDGDEWHYGYSAKQIENAPTVDAMPVTRCGECGRRYKPLDDNERNEIFCLFMNSTMMKDDFCSRGRADGERRIE